jgi:drug/metabolite transporter (DMT)-like permease
MLLVALSLVWGGSFLFARIAVAELPPLTLVLARVGIAALVLLGVTWLQPSRPDWRTLPLGAFLVMGLLNNAIPFSLIFWGQTRIGAGLAAILNAATPLFTVLLAHALTRDEKLTRARGCGVALGFAGVVVLIGPSTLTAIGGHLLAELAVVAATFSYACAGLFGRRFRGMQPHLVATGQLCASSLIMAPIVLWLDQPWTIGTPGSRTIGAVLGLALLSTALAYWFYFRILATAGATNLLLVTFLIPPSAITLGVIVLGETLSLPQLLGLALILVGLAVVDGRVFDPGRRRAPANGGGQ